MFEGFGPGTLEFLGGLAANNSRAWFDAHRKDYEDHFLTPARDFIAALEPGLRAIAPALTVEPRVNGSIFRINRDLRFSADKTPYKPHLDLWFWEGARSAPVSAFFFRLTPTRVVLGAGAIRFTGPALAKWRQAVADPVVRAEAAEVVAALDGAGLPWMGETLRRQPRGLDAQDGHHAALLRHQGLWTERDTGVPDRLGTPGFAGQCLGLWTSAAPLHRFLVRHMG